MKCDDFWKTFESSGLNESLRLHLKTCENCRNEMEIEGLLSKAAGSLPDYKAPSGMWDNIKDSLPADFSHGTPDRSKLERWIDLGARIMTALKITFLRPAFAVIPVILIVVSLGYYYFFIPPPLDRITLIAQSEESIENLERQYTDDITKFTALVEENKQVMAPEEYRSYQEKLALLSEYISQCKEALSINQFNRNARKYLLFAYDEIVVTLKEMYNKKSS